MDIIFTLLITAIIAVFASVLLKKEGAHWGIIISAAAGVILFITVLPELSSIISALSGIADNSDIGSAWLTPLLKIIGIAFLGEWGVQLCKDAGENAIACKLEMGVKIVLLVLCIPVISQLLDLITSLLHGGI